MLSGRAFTAIAMRPTPSVPSDDAVLEPLLGLLGIRQEEVIVLKRCGHHVVKFEQLHLRDDALQRSGYGTSFRRLVQPGIDAAERALAPAAAAGQYAGDRFVEVSVERRPLRERQGIEIIGVALGPGERTVNRQSGGSIGRERWTSPAIWRPRHRSALHLPQERCNRMPDSPAAGARS